MTSYFLNKKSCLLLKSLNIIQHSVSPVFLDSYLPKSSTNRKSIKSLGGIVLPKESLLRYVQGDPLSPMTQQMCFDWMAMRCLRNTNSVCFSTMHWLASPAIGPRIWVDVIPVLPGESVISMLLRNRIEAQKVAFLHCLQFFEPEQVYVTYLDLVSSAWNKIK